MALPTACRSSTEPFRDLGPARDGPFTTDTTGYVALRAPVSGPPYYRFNVVTRFRNLGEIPLYLIRCASNSAHPIFGTSMVDGSGRSSGYDSFIGCGGNNDPIVVLPGATRVDTLQLEGPDGFDETTQRSIGTVTGIFAITFLVCDTPGPPGPFQYPALPWTSSAFYVQTR